MSITSASSLAGLAAATLLAALVLIAPGARAQDETEGPAAEEAAVEAEATPAPEGETAADATVEADAEVQGASDLALVRECLETLAARGAPARVCMDIVTRSCATQPDGDTTTGAAACEERGRYAWTTLLAEQSAALEDGMSNTERERYAAAQDAWAAFRDAQCAYEAALFEGEALQSAERVACERRLTAERTIALHERASAQEQR